MSSEDSSSGEPGGGGKAVPDFSLQFVNISMNAASKEEKQRNQRMIRSAAMKDFRRKQKTQREQEKAARIRNIEPACSANDAESASTSRSTGRTVGRKALQETMRTSPSLSDGSSSSNDHSPSCQWQTTRPSPELGTFDIDAGIEEDLQVGALNNELHPVMPQVSTAISRLGGGRIDPFRMYPMDVAGSNVSELIDHSLSILWPAFRPRSTPTGESKLALAWHQKVRERPLVMHAMLFGAAVHMEVLRSPRMSLDNPIRLFHKVQTMRLLKQELKSPDKIPLDDIILAVLCLGTNEVETMNNHSKEPIYSPFNSPLGSVQWLDVYGSIAHIKEHTIAMRSLVARRGGLEHIELEGLAEVLQYSDILGATQNITKPYWPLLQRTRNGETSSVALFKPVPRYQLQNLGQGFQHLLHFGITQDIQRILLDMADLTAIIDGHVKGSGQIWDFALLIDRRNAVQHRLMSLSTREELLEGEVSSLVMYEAIRYAAITFSVAVTFPLPPLTGIFRKLSGYLKSMVIESEHDHCWQLYPKAFFWILTLGGISAAGTSERGWYVQKLASLGLALELSSWEEAVAELSWFLWVECACESGGRVLWDEVMRERLLASVFHNDADDVL